MNPPVLRCVAALALVAAAPVRAQDAPRLVQVPERVELPAPGANLLLEAEVAVEPEAIWLAVDGAAQDRVPLVRAGQLRYQLNLAAPAVADLLPASRDRGDLFVFARFGREVRQSTAVTWTRAPANVRRLRCLVRTAGTPTRRLAPGDAAWLDAMQFERIEIEGADPRQSRAVARLAQIDLPLVRQEANATWVLDPTPELRERLAESADFEIELRLGSATESFRFRSVPARLDLPQGAASFTVQQRKRGAVPGSRGWLEVRIDDITAGRVLFELVRADGSVAVPALDVHERDHVEFALAGERYVIVVRRLVNVLVGDDHAEFVVQPAEGFVADRLALLFRAIEASDATFLREGREYDGRAAAQFLRAKLAAHRGDEPSLDDFVDRIASRSSRTGEPYHVRQSDGETVAMREWLRAELRRLDGAVREAK